MNKVPKVYARTRGFMEVSANSKPLGGNETREDRKEKNMETTRLVQPDLEKGVGEGRVN